MISQWKKVSKIVHGGRDQHIAARIQSINKAINFFAIFDVIGNKYVYRETKLFHIYFKIEKND